MAVQEEGPSQCLPKPLDLTETKGDETSFADFMSPAQLKSHELHFMHRYLNAIMKKRDHVKYLQGLSPDIHKKLLALKKLQLETMELSAEFHRAVHVLEQEYSSKHEKIFQRRSEIINGTHVPSDAECEVGEDIGGLSQRLSQVVLDSATNDFKGVPNFWLTVFKLVPQMDLMVCPHDEPILKHLTDVRIRSLTEPTLSFILEFHFAPNDFFENDVLEKEYFMKCAPDASDPFAFDGPEIYKSKGMEIKWKGKEKDVTVQMKEVDGKEQEEKVQSFFNFFAPPEVLEDPNHPLFHEINAILESDFEIGFCLKDRVIPRAVVYFAGEAKEEEDGESLATTISNSISNLEVVNENSINEDVEELETDEEGDGDKKD